MRRKSCSSVLGLPQQVFKVPPTKKSKSHYIKQSSKVDPFPFQVSSSFPPLLGFPYLQTLPFPDLNLRSLLPKCEHCGYIASSGADLVKHKRSIHADQSNPFEVSKDIM